MTTRVKTQPSSRCSDKAPRVVVENAVDLRTLDNYFRAELGMSRREAKWMTREVYRDEATSRTNLPEAWHTDIWPEQVTFTRRNPGVSDPTPAQAFKNMEAAD